MADPVFSPDGKFMWTGTEWIPAPPIETPIESHWSDVVDTTHPSYELLSYHQPKGWFFDIKSLLEINPEGYLSWKMEGLIIQTSDLPEAPK